jgi:hypothetical protein
MRLPGCPTHSPNDHCLRNRVCTRCLFCYHLGACQHLFLFLEACLSLLRRFRDKRTAHVAQEDAYGLYRMGKLFCIKVRVLRVSTNHDHLRRLKSGHRVGALRILVVDILKVVAPAQV